MKDWINQKTWKDKFTPLLYASFRGNVEMCKLLLDLGADISSTNKFGLNVLHVAAQGD
jgi:palmitoyltransferase ZDHHC13/17